MNTNLKIWQKGVKDGIPIFLGYLAVSFTFGIIAKQTGISPFHSVLISATNFTSAGQLAGLSLIAGSAAYWEMAVTQLIFNSRYFLMSFAMLQKINQRTPLVHRMVMAFGLTDEIFGVSMSLKGTINPYYVYGLMSIAIPGWVLGTFFGVVSGNILPTRMISALSLALYGMLLAVIIPPAKGNKILCGLILISMIASFLFSEVPFLSIISPGVRIILLTIIIAGIAAALFPKKENSHEG